MWGLALHVKWICLKTLYLFKCENNCSLSQYQYASIAVVYKTACRLLGLTCISWFAIFKRSHTLLS